MKHAVLSNQYFFTNTRQDRDDRTQVFVTCINGNGYYSGAAHGARTLLGSFHSLKIVEKNGSFEYEEITRNTRRIMWNDLHTFIPAMPDMCDKIEKAIS